VREQCSNGAPSKEHSKRAPWALSPSTNWAVRIVVRLGGPSTTRGRGMPATVSGRAECTNAPAASGARNAAATATTTAPSRTFLDRLLLMRADTPHSCGSNWSPGKPRRRDARHCRSSRSGAAEDPPPRNNYPSPPAYSAVYLSVTFAPLQPFWFLVASSFIATSTGYSFVAPCSRFSFGSAEVPAVPFTFLTSNQPT